MDHLQASCCPSRFLFRVFSPTDVLHTLGGLKKTLVNSLWVMDCQRALSLLISVCFFLTQNLAIWGGFVTAIFSLKSLLLQPKSKIFHSFAQSRARSLHGATLHSLANTFLLLDLLFLCNPFRTCYPRTCV